jgi:Tol biopolymer transport system component
MGEVFRARDTRLGRDVALKVLPASFAVHRERSERFEREARALAALSHPGIAAIYDTVEVNGVRALVLELVEGETLEDRLRSGALPIRQAANIARAIAEALDAAHDRGLVHRDLKPANVKITPAGDVKLLDFGIARMVANDDDAATRAATAEGVVVGTAAYMSPEQARGHAVDKRADVWAFGCVLFEMLAGRAAFRGETWSDSIARTLSSEPDWQALPAATPHNLVRVLHRCLKKDPKERLRGLGGFELALDDLDTPARTRSLLPLAAIGAITLTLVAVVAMWFARRPSPSIADASPLHFEISPSLQVAESGSMGLSPDGRRIVFIGTGADGRFRMWERSFDSLETRPISGTEGEVADNSTLFWSADGRSIGFYADGAIRRIAREGGTATIVCRVPGVSVGGSWSAAGDIVVGNTAGGLMRCPAAGGEATPVTRAAAPSGGATPGGLHLFPVFLRDGQRLLYLRVSRSDPAGNGLYVADLRLPPDQQNTTRLLETGFSAKYAIDDQGREQILFVRNRHLWSAPFDSARLALTGEPATIAESVYTFRDGASFDGNGRVLVYRGGAPDSQMVWRDRAGRDLATLGDAGSYSGIALSPDGRHAAMTRENKLNRSDQDLWIVDVARNTTSRLTSDPFPESVPGWLADSQTVVYAAGHDDADVRAMPLNGGPPQTLLKHGDREGVIVNPLLTSFSASRDGAWLALSMDTRGPSRSDIWVFGVRDPRSLAPLIQQDFEQRQPMFSPDRQWLAYVSNEAGADDVFVRRLTWPPAAVPTLGAATRVSRSGGRSPRWRGDSRELFFQSPEGEVMAVSVVDGTIGEPAALFSARGALADWGVTSDGQRFLLALPVENGDLPFTVVVNWQAAVP